MKKTRYRILKNQFGLYEIERKSFFGFWKPIMEWDGCDPLGFDYGYSEKTFKTVEDAEKYISDLDNMFTRKVVKEIS